jgi:uncharacterized protein (DUF488 family)
MSDRPTPILSIGHSNHMFGHFTSLLARHGVECVVDVRSSPWSRYAPQFNREALQPALAARGLGYRFLGAELGGRPSAERFYDDDGHVLYGLLAGTEFFRRGIETLEAEARARRIAIMCSEEDPTGCHRRLLVARVLEQRGVQVEHIRGDGRVQINPEFESSGPQGTLFAEEKPWRSTQSVSHRRRRNTSSAA